MFGWLEDVVAPAVPDFRLLLQILQKAAIRPHSEGLLVLESTSSWGVCSKGEGIFHRYHQFQAFNLADRRQIRGKRLNAMEMHPHQRMGGRRWVKGRGRRRRENDCWRIHSGQVSQDATAVGTEGWAPGWPEARGHELQTLCMTKGTGTYLCASQGTGARAGTEDSNFPAFRLWGYNSPGFPLFRIPPWMHQLEQVFCYLGIECAGVPEKGPLFQFWCCECGCLSGPWMAGQGDEMWWKCSSLYSMSLLFTTVCLLSTEVTVFCSEVLCIVCCWV